MESIRSLRLANFLALASVTATISYILEEVNRDVSGIKITAKPLDAIETQSPVNGLNIFLYHVAPYSAVDSVEPLIVDDNGNAVSNPLLNLDLHYLVTATSSENDDLVAQKIIASAMRILNEHPILSRDLIRSAIRNSDSLASSDLGNQVEDIRLSLDPITSEESTKIWSTFPSANYRPSIAYTANVVVLESKLVDPATKMRSIPIGRIGQLKSPDIERVDPLILEFTPNAQIMVLGENFQSPATSIVFNDTISVKPARPQDISNNRILVTIPPELEPGILRLNIKHYLSEESEKAKPHSGAQAVLKSNASPFVLAPRIISPREGKVKKGSDLVVEFQPGISIDRDLFILLGDNSYRATLVKGTGAQPEKKFNVAKITISDDIVEGIYLLRISVGGAESRLVTDDRPSSPTFKKAIAPFVEVVR